MRLDQWFPALYIAAYAVAGFAVHLRGGPVGDLDLETDFYGDLVLAAERLARGEFSVLDYPYKGPLYAFVLVPLHVVVANWFRCAVLLNLGCAAACLFAVRRLAGSIFGARTAVPTMLLLSLVPDFWVHSHHASTDLLFLLLALCSVLLFGSTGGMWKTRAAAGAVAGFAFLTRYSGACLPAAAIAAIAIASPRGTSWAVRTRQVVVYLVAFLLVCAPWFAASWRETGHLVATKNMQNLATGLFAGPRWAYTHIEDREDLGRLVAQDPRHAAGQFLHNLADHLRRDLGQLLGWPGAILGLLGMVGVLLRPPSRALWSYLCFPLIYFLLMGALFYAPRFFFFLVPAYYGMGLAIGLGDPDRPWAAWTGRWRRRRAGAGNGSGTGTEKPVGRYGALAFLVLVGAIALVQVQRVASTERAIQERQPRELLPAAQTLRAAARATGESVVMARKGHIAFLAGLQYQPYSRAAARTLESLLEFARAHRVGFVVYGGPEFELVPDLRFLAVADTVPGLSLVYATPALRIFHLEDAASTGRLRDAEKLTLLRTNLRLAEERGAPDQEARVLGDLARFHTEHGDVAAAEGCLRRAVEVCDRSALGSETMRTNAAIGRQKLAALLLSTGRAEEAQELATTSLAYFEAAGAPPVVARACITLGRCQAALGHTHEAARLFERARKLDPTVRIPAGSRSGGAPPPE